MAEPSLLLDIATRIAGWARGGEQVEAYVARGRDTDVRVHQGEIESLSTADSEGVGVRVVRDGRQGFAYAGSLDDDVLRETLDEARDNAGFGTPDEHVAVASPAGVPPAEVDVWREELASFPTHAKVALALELERRVRTADPRIRAVEQAAYGDFVAESAVATSTGIAVTSRRTGANMWTEAIAGAGDDTQTGFGYSVARQPGDLDLDRAVRDAVEHATRLLGAVKPPSARFTVVLEPEVTSAFLGVLASTLNGESVLKGRSLFADRVGEQVSVPFLTLADDPTDPAAARANPFDAEGLASRRTVLIEDGVLRGFVYDTYAASRAGTRSTASAVRSGFKSAPGVGCRAVSLVPGARSREEILASIDRGMLVQDVSGLHSGVNTVSGDFSVGARGILIRDGALDQPVREVTIASTIQRMLQNVVAVGDDLAWGFGSAAQVTLVVADVTMSGA